MEQEERNDAEFVQSRVEALADRPNVNRARFRSGANPHRRNFRGSAA